MGRFIDLTGQRFGRLVVLSRAKNDNDGKARWSCLCDCGVTAIVQRSTLRRGESKSCGCLKKELAAEAKTTHGMHRTPIYKTWSDMKTRCLNENDTNYKYYGGRGITVCERWLEFENFYADMGDKPEGLTIERRNNDKGYSPGNCYWATHSEQQRNTRINRMIRYNGKKQCLSAWAEETGIHCDTLRYRLKHYPPQLAFNM